MECARAWQVGERGEELVAQAHLGVLSERAIPVLPEASYEQVDVQEGSKDREHKEDEAFIAARVVQVPSARLSETPNYCLTR